MNFIDKVKDKVKNNIRTIVLPETEDIRTLKAAELIEKEKFVKLVLIGKEEEINKIANENNIKVTSEIINPETYDKIDELVNEYYELRKHKGVSLEDARQTLLNNYLYFGCMLVKLGYADGQVSGASHSTADTLRPALQILKTAEGSKVASSFMLMDVPNCEFGENGVFVFSDCGMIQNPSSEELAEIGKASAESFELLVGKEAKVAFLSHSTFGTSKCDDVDKVNKAVSIAKETYPELNCDGEIQFDAAIVPEVAKKKAPNSKVAGQANVLIFPDLDAGNIGYKMVERLAKAEAYGPITQGLSKPVNDLSRGCKAEDIVGAVAITALQVKDK